MAARTFSEWSAGWSSLGPKGSLLKVLELLIFAAVPAAVVALEEPSPTSARAETGRLELQWSDHYRLLEEELPFWGRRAVEDEIEVIFEEIGVVVSWPGATGGSASAVRIVLLPVDPEGWRQSRATMGAVLDRSSSERAAYIFLPNVVRSVGAEGSPRLWRPSKVLPLLRALARVVAHEIAHVIAPDIPHDPTESLMSAHLHTRMLIRTHLSFSAATGVEIRTRLQARDRSLRAGER